jgi:hypothetical protein
VFVLKGELVLDLLELGLYPRVTLVTMSVKFGKIAQTLVYAAMIHLSSSVIIYYRSRYQTYKPTRRFWKYENECGKKNGRNNLDPKTGAPLAVVGWIEADIRACNI